MKRKISVSKAHSHRIMLRGFLRWLFYALLLLLFYLWETNPLIKGFCPLLLIPLATSVALREGELAAGVFGAFCGIMLDMASGTIVGFSALWLLVCCPVISLLSQFWIKINFISHFVMNLAVSIIMAAMDFLFLHWVWEGGDSAITFGNTVLPAYLGAVAGAIPVYFLVTLISNKMRIHRERRPEESSLAAEDAKDVMRE